MENELVDRLSKLRDNRDGIYALLEDALTFESTD